MIFERYRRFLRLPHVRLLLVMGLAMRLPISTVSFAMLMHVRALTGSFSVAGAAVGAYLAASATTAPVIGRFIDRYGPRPALVFTGSVCPLALLVLLSAGWIGLSDAGMITVAAVAGSCVPPITVLTRTMWRYRFDDEEDRRTAFSADSVLIELTFTAGPAIIALLLAISTPVVAFAAAWTFSVISVPLFLASPVLRYWRHDPHADRHLLGPLTEPRLLVVFAATFMLTISFGLIEVGYPGFATAAGMPAFAGVLLAVNSVGSAIGGLTYGGLHIKLPIERQLPRVLMLVSIPLAAQALVTSPALLAAVALFAGLCIAPSLTMVTLLVSSNTPSRYATEAFTWSSTCIVSGLGLGNALGGRLVESHGAPTVFVLSGVMVGCAALCALFVRARLTAQA